MSLVNAFLYPFRSYQTIMHFAELVLISVVVAVALFPLLPFLVLLVWIGMIKQGVSNSSEMPNLHYSEEFRVILTALTLYCLSFGLLAFTTRFLFWHQPVITALVIGGISLFEGLLFLVGLARYAATGQISSLLELRQNIAYLIRYRVQAARLLLKLGLYSLMIVVFTSVLFFVTYTACTSITTGSFITGIAAGIFLISVTGTGMTLFMVGTGYLLGEWARSMGLSHEKAKRKNDHG